MTNQTMPAPALSPLDENYRQGVEKVAGALNGLKPGAVTIHRFDSMGQFAEVMKGLVGSTRPYKLAL